MSEHKYQTIHRMPNVKEYIDLCSSVGWQEVMNFDAAEQSLQHSCYGVVIEYNREAVGMGRIVGDGIMYFYVQDIVVKPEHQSKGLGQLIMKAIQQYLSEHAAEKAFVGLFSAQGKESFYQKYGFNVHQGMTGMFGVIHDREIK
ncbi:MULTISPECIES: GNAT family N-acetyltransferase [unclassified Paenibacillus]|uniref:GNAT family N-acetyltransferase n=1 Tax=unclassified Paenibacillus TaxID=185978 RepID=UPI00089A355B|nr:MULTISPECIES: GNAT family N-acetyltransferase [unclassified Paenibacillus]OMC71730.1 GNAT family N-acetyltransferase [Paenibacillus sp. FSL H7-0326]SDW35845.1 Acetyltransferase (GNAT) domain-containing protein [Paenibacillus sp. PDC88]